jgi:hypothetical protein
MRSPIDHPTTMRLNSRWAPDRYRGLKYVGKKTTNRCARPTEFILSEVERTQGRLSARYEKVT